MASTKPGQRKLQILQALAAMLEQPKGEKITTAALAARLEVSEAALYRHFASKAQMFEGLIEFIESSVFGLINQISEREANGVAQAHAIMQMLLAFAANNPGMTRVLIGDALVNEDERLQLRMNQFYDKVELACKQSLRVAVTQGHGNEADVAARASLLVSYVVGPLAPFRQERLPPESHRRHRAPAVADARRLIVPASMNHADCFALLDDASPDAGPGALAPVHAAARRSCAATTSPAGRSCWPTCRRRSRAGLYAVPLLAYELGGAAARHPARTAGAAPLAQVLLFERCEHLAPHEVGAWLAAQAPAATRRPASPRCAPTSTRPNSRAR